MYFKTNLILNDFLFPKKQQDTIKFHLEEHVGDCAKEVFIAGGAVVDWLNNIKPKDVDVFIKCDQIPKTYKKLVQVSNEEYKSFVDRFDSWGVYKNTVDHFDLCFIKSKLSIEEYVSKFDFNISKMYIDDLDTLGKMVGLQPAYQAKECAEGLKTKTIIMKPDRAKQQYIDKRVERYKVKYPDFKFYQEL